MNKNLKFILLFCLLSIRCMTFAQGNPRGYDPLDLKDGDKCPTAVLKDSLGLDQTIKSLRGKYVFIDVWASWCYPCYKQVPSLIELEKKMQNENIVFLGISVDAQEFRWKGMLKGMPGIQWWDKNESFRKAFHLGVIPRCILISPKGKIVKAFMTLPSNPETLEFMKTLFDKNRKKIKN